MVRGVRDLGMEGAQRRSQVDAALAEVDLYVAVGAALDGVRIDVSRAHFWDLTAVGALVITSYSIHYTKLYEVVGSGAR